ncbi:SLC8A2 [Symbiodinium pilosum]|uniref:SLC8A2 protein n=1 Tax=Symbiodinium pilosum TaxID=2952 RepID=A0A812L0N8_SYMPI|nr:SLC8A2 [Symbiodinium pilosum]
MSFESFEARVKECYAEDNPAKGNDLKPLYGALFQDELVPFSHWGWTDLDMVWGRLDEFLTPQLLAEYDVISAPDGARPALYLSGQLTVFQNTGVWRRFLDGCLQGEGHVNYGGCYVEGLLSEANLFFDEKLAIWYAALRKARIYIDFSWLLIEPRWARLSGRGPQKLTRERGRLLVHGSQGLPFADMERWNMEVHRLQNTSDCYTEFGPGWSFVCIPSEAGDSFGAAYEIGESLMLWPSPPHLLGDRVEFAALHLHRSKQGFQWESCPTTAVCNKEHQSAIIGCTCGSTAPSISWSVPIPNIVHLVLTDRDTRFFDWPCYAAVRSAREKLQPEKLLVHVLDGVEPSTFNDWWQAAKAFISDVVPFPRSAVPNSLNGLRLSHPAFIADFIRIKILHDWGGIYMDADALSLRGFEELRRWRAVLARQGGEELRATVGLMMFEKGSPLLPTLLDRMKRAYTGSWGIHAGHVLDDMLASTRPPGVAILAHSSGFFASSWHASDFVELMEESGTIDWRRCWSLHLYNSQTKRFTKDPVELCRDSPSYRSGDLCAGLRMAIDMDSIYSMVGSGYPVMNSRIEEAFRKRAEEQTVLFESPVSHSLDIQREVDRGEL